MALFSHQKHETYIAPWEQTKWLVLSSCFFLIPATYAYIHTLYLHSTVLFITSLISANFWRKATFSWRRNLDLVYAKCSFILFVYDGVVYVRTVYYVVPGYIGLFVLLYCFYVSGKLLESKKEYWYKYHVLFHFIMAYEQFIIIDSILRNRYLK
jgi:hypothetical protein